MRLTPMFARRAARARALAAVAVLAGSALAACGESGAAFAPDIVGDRTPPRVRLVDQKAAADSLIAFAVGASDNLGLKSVRVRVTGGVTRSFDTTLTSVVTSLDVPFTFVVSRAVPPGTSVLAVATATDGAGNSSAPDTLRLIVGNLTPPVAVITGPVSGTLFVTGKSGVIAISAKAGLKVRTVGFETSGPYRTADSTIFASPLRDTVAILDTLAIPDTVKTGILTVTPFVVDSLGQRVAGRPVTFSVQPITAVNSTPVVTTGVTRRIEVLDTVHVRATDPTGIRVLGYEVRTTDERLLATAQDSLRGELTTAQRTFQLRLPVTDFPTNVYVRGFAVNGAGKRAFATLASGAARSDTAIVVAGVTRGLPDGGRLADGIYFPRTDRLYLTNIERNQLEVFSLADTAFLAPVGVGSRPWGISAWPRTRGGVMADTLLVANSGGTNISYVDLRRGSTGREFYRYPLPNIITCAVTTELSQAGVRMQQRTCYDFSDRPQFIASNCQTDAAGPTAACSEVILAYTTTPTGGQSRPFANMGTVRWENLTQQSSHFFFEQAYGQALKRADTLEVIRYAAGGVGADSILVPYRQTMYDANGDSSEFSVVVDPERLVFRDTTYIRNSGDFRRSVIGEGGPVLGSRAMMYDATRGLNPMWTDILGNSYFLSLPVFDRGVSRAHDVTDFVANTFARVLGVAINFDGEIAAVRGDSTYLFDRSLRLQGLLQTSGGPNAGFDFHPLNAGANTSVAGARLAFSASRQPQIDIFDTYCYKLVATIPVREPIVGPIRASARPNGQLMLVGASERGVIVVNVQNRFSSSCQ